MDETQQHEEYEEHTGVSIYWWVRQIILILIAGFYLVFGIQLLISAYKLNDPASFILTFYASNFMILFSAALLVGFIYRLVATYRRSKKAPPQSHTL
jgi:heme/copper-type cytochrome/quinol oxidase subunit 2